jgi:hypothetical protein
MTAPDLLSHAHEARRLAAEVASHDPAQYTAEEHEEVNALSNHADEHYGDIAAAYIEAVEERRQTLAINRLANEETARLRTEYEEACEQIVGLRAALSEARTALAPFAHPAFRRANSQCWLPEHAVYGRDEATLTRGDFQRAESALSAAPAKEGEKAEVPFPDTPTGAA